MATSVAHLSSDKNVLKEAKDDDDILKERLLTRETVFLGRSAKKVLQKYYSFGAATVAESSTAQERLSAAEAMRCELRLFGLEVKKTGLSIGVWQRELRECAELEASIVVEQASTKREIVDLQASLKTAHRVRHFKDECEAVARQVLKLPSIQTSSDELDKLEAEIAIALARAKAAADDLERKARRYALLLACVSDLTPDFHHVAAECCAPEPAPKVETIRTQQEQGVAREVLLDVSLVPTIIAKESGEITEDTSLQLAVADDEPPLRAAKRPRLSPSP